MFADGIIAVFEAKPHVDTVWINEAGDNWAWYARPGFSPVSRNEVLGAAKQQESVEEKTIEKNSSIDYKASEAIEAVEVMRTVDEIELFIEGDTRKGVNKAATERIKSLEA